MLEPCVCIFYICPTSAVMDEKTPQAKMQLPEWTTNHKNWPACNTVKFEAILYINKKR